MNINTIIVSNHTNIMEFLYNPWPWYIAGPAIASIMLLLYYFGESFGISDNLRTMCTMAGGGRFADFFKIDWKEKIWNLVFTSGAILGGYIAVRYMSRNESIDLNPETIEKLDKLGFANAGSTYLPPEIFSSDKMMEPKGIIILLIGGLLVGFGTRYAGGCTSGHAISGLSNLQIPSLIATIGFFIGGLLMIHLIFPFIFPSIIQ